MTPRELKNSILQLAIKGRLVEQREDDSPVDLSGIKMKPTDEFEFDLPANWKIGHLECVTEAIPSKQYQILESQVLQEGAYAVISQSKAYSIGYSNESEKVFHHLQPVIIFGDHTTEIKLVDFDFVVGADGVKIFQAKSFVYPTFLFYVLQYLCIDLNKIGGYSRHYKYIKNKPIPIPPLEEQKRIVARIEVLQPLVDRYEQAWNRLEDLNKRFPGDLQKSLLQLSIQGKLVEQHHEEGKAAELYVQIQREKQELIKAGKLEKEKPFPEITEDEKPFDIPESWLWVRFNTVISLLSGSDLTPDKYNTQSKGIPYITGASNFDGTGLIINRWTEFPNNIAHKGDLLLTCKGTVGKTIILKEQEAHIARQIMAITPIMVDTVYIRYFIDSQIDVLKSKAKSMIPGIERENVLKLAMPLPPLAEQKRIVAKLEVLLPLCEKLN